MTEPAVEQSIREERTRLLAQQCAQGTRSAFVVATVLGLLIVPAVGPWRYGAWLTAMIVCLLAVNWTVRRVLKRQPLTAKDEQSIGMSVMLLAIIINIPSALFFPDMSMEVRSIYSTISVVWVGTAAVILGLRPASYASYVGISMAMMAIGWWRVLTPLWALGITAMLGASGMLFVQFSRRLTRLFNHSIEVRQTNQILVNKLTASPTETTQAQKTVEQSIREERTRMSAQQCIQGTRSAFVVATLLSVLMVPAVGPWAYGAWLATILVTFPIRNWYVQRTLLHTPLTEHSERKVDMASMLLAVVINLPAALFMPAMGMEARGVYSTIAIAWVGAATAILGLRPRSYAGYVAISVSLMAIGWWRVLTPWWALALTVMLMAMGMLFVTLSIRLTRLFNDSIEIRQTNQVLVNKLTASLTETAQAQKTRSRFLAAASHDLLQPVHALLLLVGVLRDSTSEGTRQQAAWRIEQTAYAIETMFRGLLDQARLDAGAVAPRIDTVTLATVCRAIEAAYLPRCQDKNLRFSLDCAPDLRVRADAALLDRALRNLVDNAVKFTTQGQVAISARREETAVVVTIQDTGAGIQSEEVERVFDAFFRGESATHTGVEGVGLGLAVTQQLLQLMGAKIALQSDAGCGTCVTLRLPAAEANDVTVDPFSMHPPKPAPLPYTRILIIEDDHSARDALALWLRNQDCQVLAVGSLAEAMAQCQAQDFTPQCLLSDQRLTPGPDGLTTIGALRAHFGPLPAVLITGEPMDPDAMPADIQLVRKPVKPEQLRTVLRYHSDTTP